jgi:cytochrome P450
MAVKGRAEAKVTAVVGSADHDPSVFPDPDALQVRRPNEQHMSFGAGIHDPYLRAVTNLPLGF